MHIPYLSIHVLYVFQVLCLIYVLQIFKYFLWIYGISFYFEDYNFDVAQLINFSLMFHACCINRISLYSPGWLRTLWRSGWPKSFCWVLKATCQPAQLLWLIFPSGLGCSSVGEQLLRMFNLPVLRTINKNIAAAAAAGTRRVASRQTFFLLFRRILVFAFHRLNKGILENIFQFWEMGQTQGWALGLLHTQQALH